jgi:hypothetical protein
MCCIEEGRAASISISQQVVSVDITKNSAVAIFEWWILEWTYLYSSTQKGFEKCVREETAHLKTLKFKKYISWLPS